jgi:RND family efflux transporter MFP subunit
MSNADLLKELAIERRKEDHREPERGRRMWIVFAIVLVLAALGIGVWLYMDSRATPVHTAQVSAASKAPAAGTVLQATGYVTARRQATVSAQITGTLTAVLIEEGDHVKEGQILAKLDDSQYKAQLDQAVAQAKAAYALVDQYQVQLAQSERDAVRSEQLAGRGLVSKQLAEQARTLVNTTRAQLLSQRRQASAADQQVNVAKVNFGFCLVRAPFDGVVTTKDAQVGEIVSPFSAGGGFTRTGIGTVVDMDSLEVDVDVNEAYIGRVKADMRAEAALDAYPDWRIPAHIIAIVPAADRSKATVKVRVAIDLKDARIVPDMGVRASFLDSKPDASAPVVKGVLVPNNAIVKRGTSNVVFLVANGKAWQTEIPPSSQVRGDTTLVPSSLSIGDSVVVAPPNELRDGSAVRVQTE